MTGVPASAFTPAYRNYVLALLTLTFTLNVVDRNILTILLQPIKADLGLSDTQLGAISGVAFALFYAVFAIPLGMWADRGNRSTVLAATLALFSAMTGLCALATNFVQLMLARIFTAVGEAGTSPCSHSIISDLVPREKRASALGTYLLGTNFGYLISFAGGGWIAQVYGWRAAFLIVGIPGVILAVVVRLTLKPPPRGHSDVVTAQGVEAPPSIVAVLKLLWSRHSFRHIVCGGILSSIAGTAIASWFPSFLSRSHGMTSGEIGTALAVIQGGIGIFGIVLVSRGADALGHRDVRWNMWLVALVNLAALPACLGVYAVEGRYTSLAFYAYPGAVLSAFMAPAIAMTHALVTVRMRAQASAIYYLFMSLIGLALGPQLTGLISDHYRPILGDESLRRALMVMSFFWLWSALHFALAARTLKSDIERVREFVAA